jgi:glycosyltransferase involved in cell wall biosynthesis
MSERTRTVVLFVHGPPVIGGDSVVVLRTLTHLDLETFEPIVVVPPASEAWQQFQAVTRPRGIDLVPLEMGVESHLEAGLLGQGRPAHSRVAQGTALAQATVQLLWLAARRRVDVVYTLDRSRAVIPATLTARLLRRALVWHGHQPWNAWGWAVRSADRVVLITDFVRREYERQGVDPKRMRVVYNGVDVEAYASAGDPMGTRRRLGVAADTPLVLMPGRLSRYKGQLELVEAMPAIIRACPQAQFIFAGGDTSEVGDLQTSGVPSMRAVLSARASELGVDGHARFVHYSGPGTDEEMAKLFAAADVVVVPSWTEPFGLVVIEAMASGTAVVGSAAGGIPESIVDQETGLLVPPRRPDAIASAVAALLADPDRRARMGQAGQRRARDRFTVERYCRDLEAVLLDAAGKTGTGTRAVPTPLSPEPIR